MAKIPSEEKPPYQFPSGLRVLAIDTDPTVLDSIRQMSSRCQYHVVTCSDCLLALTLVRKKKDYIDVILTEVHMPNMDGFEFLQHVNKEINVPVIMMSVDDAKCSVMKAVKLGACDYWIKPLHEGPFRNMWTHVARKALSEDKKQENYGRSEDGDRKKRRHDNSEFASSVTDVVRDQNNSSSKEGDDVDESEHSGPPRKKPRVVWTPELHRVFVKAVNQLGGLDKAVPKKILELMNIPDLSRDNVASHLQKYRHYLKISSDGVTQQRQMPLPKTVPGTIESRVGASGRSNSQALPATSNVPYLTPATFHPGLTNDMVPKEEKYAPTIQGDASRYYGVWPPSNTVAIENQGVQRNNVPIDTLQQQRQQVLMLHQIHSTNYPPSPMMVSGNPSSVTQNCSFGSNIDYCSLPPQSINSQGVVQIHGGNNNVYTTPASVCPQFQVSGLRRDAVRVRSFPESVPDPTLVHYGSRFGDSIYQESPTSLGDGDKDIDKEEPNSMIRPEEDPTVL